MTHNRFLFLIIAIIFWAIMFFGGQYIMFQYYKEFVPYILGGIAWVIVVQKGIRFIIFMADIFAPLDKTKMRH